MGTLLLASEMPVPIPRNRTVSALRGTTNTDCVSFVQDCTVKNECKLYNLPEFLTKLRTFIQNLAAQNIGKSNGAAATVNTTVREVQKACAIKNCVNPLKLSFHTYCPKHYQALRR